MPWPMPWAPPVTSATWPFKLEVSWLINADNSVFIESVGAKAIQVGVKILSEIAFNCVVYDPLYSSELPGVMKRDGRSEFGAL